MFYIKNSTPQIDEIVNQLKISADVYVTLREQKGAVLQIEKNGNQATVTFGRPVELFRALGLLAEHCTEEDYSTIQPARFKMETGSVLPPLCKKVK